MAPHCLDVGHPASEALADEDPGLYLCHVEPAAVDGRVDEPEPRRHLRSQQPLEGGFPVCCEVVQHDSNGAGIGVGLRDGKHEGHPLAGLVGVPDLHDPPSGMGVDGGEGRDRALADVLVVQPLDRVAGAVGLPPPAQQPRGGLVHADDGVERVVGQPVGVQHRLHPFHEGRVGLRGG